MSRSFLWHVHCSGIYIRDVPFNKVNLLPVKISCRWRSSTCKRLGNVPHYKYKEKSHQRVSAHQAAAHQGPLESQRAASHGAHQAINYQDILESQGVAANTRLLPLKKQLQLTKPHCSALERHKSVSTIALCEDWVVLNAFRLKSDADSSKFPYFFLILKS